MRFQAEGVTDVGRRRQGNEDGMLVNDDIGLLAVADGMGGHRGGEVASATALESLRTSVAAGLPIREAIEAANEAVLQRAAADPELSGMGTTLTAGTIGDGNTLVLGHVGDSRAYLLRDGELRQITEDHSLVEEMVRDGRLTREQAAHHPQRSIITRALGVDHEVDVDIEPIELEAGDRLLLCSDGLTSMISEEEIAEILRGLDDPGEAADRLIDAANEAGGEDNITAVVADFVPDAEAAEVAAAAVPGAAADTPATDASPAERRQARPRRRKVLRLALIVLPVLLILGIGVAATAWYARSNYFVGIDDSTVTVFKGLPDGLLIWDPTVEETTDIDVDDLTEAQRGDLEDGKRFSSKESADEYVARLQESIDEADKRRDDTRDGGGDRDGQNRNRQRNRSSTTTTTTTTTAAPPAGP